MRCEYNYDHRKYYYKEVGYRIKGGLGVQKTVKHLHKLKKE